MPLIEQGDGSWLEPSPTHCPNGHRLGPNRVVVGWDNMLEVPVRTWTCLKCGAIIYGE